jgi:cytochrome c553
VETPGLFFARPIRHAGSMIAVTHFVRDCAAWVLLSLLCNAVATAASAGAGAEVPATRPGDPVKGAARSEVLFCAGCHGPGGRSATPQWPSLAGQGEAYLGQQLRLIRAGERYSQEMAPVAETLTDEDIADLAAYYAAQTPRPGAPASADPQAAGDLYLKGDAARSIQACAACHGPEGRGDGKTVTPALRSQQSTYISAQLEAYSRRSRYQSAVPSGLPRAGIEAMYDLSARLTEDEVQQLAQYLQSLP